MTYRYVVLHLSLIPDIGPATVQHLVATLGDLELLSTLYDYSSAQLSAQFGITPKRAQALANGLADLSLLEREAQLIDKHAVSWTTAYCPDYPALLRTIHMPPLVIYWRGKHPAEYEKPVAVVGSRDANHYGHAITKTLVPALVQSGCTIVSGGALGIDSMAHRATLEADGITCVVLGSGLLHLYPFENSKLFASVLEHGGTLLSIFSLNTRPLSGNFPARNRVISGLSKGCVVIQAAQKSGARITAECALEQGRSVCAVPGPIDDPLSAGCHDLIRNGALLATSADDVLQELEYHEQDMANKTNTPVQKQNVVADNQPTYKPAGLVRSTEQVTPTKVSPAKPLTPAQRIVQLCAQPISVDSLMEATELSFAELNELLFDLQIAGKVTQTFAGLWCTRK